MKLKKMFQYDAFDFLQSVNIMFMKKCKKHNHDLNYVDQTKINDDVQNVFDKEIRKDYKFAHISKNIQNVKFEINHVVFKTTKDLIMNLKIVHNVEVDFLRANLDFNRRDNNFD